VTLVFRRRIWILLLTYLQNKQTIADYKIHNTVKLMWFVVWFLTTVHQTITHHKILRLRTHSTTQCLQRFFILRSRSIWTSTPAVAEKPRDTSCLSVVSFSSTIRQAQSSVISYFRFRFTAALRTNKFCSLFSPCGN